MNAGGRSGSVRFEELRRLLRLASDLRDLPAGSDAQRLQALQGLGALVGAQVGLWLDVEGVYLRRAIDVGWSGERERRVFLSYLQGDQENCVDPSLERMAAAARAPVFVVTREQLVGDREWYRSEHVQRYRRGARVDSFIGAAAVGPGGRAQCISLHRPWGDRPFSERERRLVETFYRECAFLHAPAPAPARGPASTARPPPASVPPPSSRSEGAHRGMPQRLRDTLRGLCRGLSEKELAAELGLSPHTVHEYVKALYRRFRVKSRAELLAAHLGRR